MLSMPETDADVRLSSEQQQQQHQQQQVYSAYTSFKHNAALALLVGAPVLIAIPPRKLDLYTFSLAGAFIVSANHLTREKTGRSILQQFGYQYAHNQSNNETRRSILDYDIAGNTVESGRNGSKLEQTVKQAWLGDEGSDWKQKRLKEEQDKLDQGEGYADMIVDQIWDVWNQKKDDTDKKR